MTLLFLLIGLAAGVLAGLFGIGGGILIVPALLFFAPSPTTAPGTSTSGPPSSSPPAYSSAPTSGPGSPKRSSRWC
jgi:uncharacterized membrane protein YfcA